MTSSSCLVPKTILFSPGPPPWDQGPMPAHEAGARRQEDAGRPPSRGGGAAGQRTQSELSLAKEVDGVTQDARGLLGRVEPVRVLRLHEVHVELAATLEGSGLVQGGRARARLLGGLDVPDEVDQR